MKRSYLAVYLMALSAVAVVDAKPRGGPIFRDTPIPEDRAVNDENAPVDYGWGPRPPPSSAPKGNPISAIETTAEGFREFDAATVPVEVDAHLKGQFGDPFS